MTQALQGFIKIRTLCLGGKILKNLLQLALELFLPPDFSLHALTHESVQLWVLQERFGLCDLSLHFSREHMPLGFNVLKREIGVWQQAVDTGGELGKLRELKTRKRID